MRSSDPMAFFGPLLVIGLTVAVVALVVWWSQQQYAAFLRAWETFALARGLRYNPPTGSFIFRTPPTVEGTIDQIAFQFDTYTVSHGKSSTTYTRVKAFAIDPIQSTIRVYQEHIFSGLGKALGFQDVELGDPEFDDRFVVKADRDDDARALLDPAARKAFVAFPRGFNFTYTAGAVDLHWVGLEKDHAVLDAACRIVAAACRWRRDTVAYR